MKVKPWASTEETLAALHTTLVARSGCDIFWSSLCVLLETLARDLKARQMAAPGTVVDNEVLDGERFNVLLDEIRAVLDRQGTETPNSTFRRLASTLSAPALMLLLLLGGAASIGCGTQPMHHSARDAEGLPDAYSLQPEADGPAHVPQADASNLQPDSKEDVPIILLPDAKLLLPDQKLDAKSPGDTVTHNSDGATVTIQDIMDSCGIPNERQSSILSCLSKMHESWSTDMPRVLAGQDCTKTADQLRCFADWTCNSAQDTKFKSGSTPICQPVRLYLGVCFV
jgi:hypothetical protein